MKLLQKHGHIQGQVDDAIFAHDILGVENVGVTDFTREFLLKFIQRGMGAIVAGFDFDRRDFSIFGDEEIDFHVILTVEIVVA